MINFDLENQILGKFWPLPITYNENVDLETKILTFLNLKT